MRLLKALLLVLALCGLGILGWSLLPPGGEVRVDIPAGVGASETARILEREGVIRSALFFKAAAKLSGADRSLKPGIFLFRKGMGVWRALGILREGRSERVRILVPEGFMASQIALRLEEAGVTGERPFLDYVRENNLEGFLFPTTYFFSRGMDAGAVAHHMHAEFSRYVEPEFASLPQERFTLAQAVALASIVQREAMRSSEMPTIAGVYLNRLSRRMRLEADPTVQYALGSEKGVWKIRLTRYDLKTYSRYNTYLNFGLPPGPICSPGLEALRSVLRPARTDALYFVADNTGTHVFSRTIEEHNRARERIKRALRPSPGR